MPVFKKLIEANFGFLRELDYRAPKFSSRSHAILGNIATALFRAQAREIDIEVTSPSPPHKPQVSVHVYREPRKSVEDDLELNLFLRKHRPDVAAEISRLENDSGSAAEFMAAALPVYANALATDARAIVAGDAWESGFYTSWV